MQGACKRLLRVSYDNLRDDPQQLDEDGISDEVERLHSIAYLLRYVMKSTDFVCDADVLKYILFFVSCYPKIILPELRRLDQEEPFLDCFLKDVDDWYAKLLCSEKLAVQHINLFLLGLGINIEIIYYATFTLL